MRESLKCATPWLQCRACGTELGRPDYLASLAAAYGKAGRTDDALALVAEALALVESRDERDLGSGDIPREGGVCCSSPEVHPKPRPVFAAPSKSPAARARSPSSFARRRAWPAFSTKQGRQDEARRMLGEIYGWFTEGFDTADLKDAKALLDALS